MKEKWDDRYSTKEFAYGKEPNNYLKQQLIKIPAECDRGIASTIS